MRVPKIAPVQPRIDCSEMAASQGQRSQARGPGIAVPQMVDSWAASPGWFDDQQPQASSQPFDGGVEVVVLLHQHDRRFPFGEDLDVLPLDGTGSTQADTLA